MDLIFKDPGFQYSISMIMEFQGEDMSDWWSESLFYFYPSLDQAHFKTLTVEEKRAYLTSKLQSVFKEQRNEITQKLQEYQDHWDHNKDVIEAAFHDAFQIDVTALCNDMKGNISLNPICPRFLDTHVFDIFYLSSHKGALGMALHEMTHFLWFHVWQQVFHDDPAVYEAPHLQWLFSEMAPHFVLQDPRFVALNPYAPDHIVYDYFYTMKVEDRCILDTLQELYDQHDMVTFMKEGYAYCERFADEILAQVL